MDGCVGVILEVVGKAGACAMQDSVAGVAAARVALCTHTPHSKLASYPAIAVLAVLPPICPAQDGLTHTCLTELPIPSVRNPGVSTSAHS